jgi:small subunit ribosomal protein S1
VSKLVSDISSVKEVRAKMVKIQRRISSNKSIVIDGRDIGTVVFPDAEFKFFLTASIHSRAKRRFDELQESDSNVTLEQIEEEIKSRDYFDTTRENSPLKKAEEGVEGLIHISEISWTKHIKHPSDLYALGDIIKAKVLSIEKSEKKISLGIKQLTSNPWDDIESSYKVGDVRKGTVKNITQFGAFINLDDNIDGLLHISDMSWTKTIRHPKEFLAIDDEVDVKILEVSSEEKKISLGIKQLQENPWETLSEEFTSGKNIKGKVIKILDKAVFFNLDHDVEGLLFPVQ